MKLACGVLHSHFGLVYLLQVSKIDEEQRCFLQQLGFIEAIFAEKREKKVTILPLLLLG
jgi:hypothetical protein